MFVVLPPVKRAPTSYALLNAFQSLTHSKTELHPTPPPHSLDPQVSFSHSFWEQPHPSLRVFWTNSHNSSTCSQSCSSSAQSLDERQVVFSNSEVAKPWLASPQWGKTCLVSHKPQSGLPSCLPRSPHIMAAGPSSPLLLLVDKEQ